MNTIEDTITLISNRDNISYFEATSIVEDCLDELRGAVIRGNYQEAEDIVASYLSLEPDFLSILLEEMF